MPIKQFALFALLATATTLAHAGIADGTPRFSIKFHPTMDANGNPLPTTGPKALKETRIFCDVDPPVKPTYVHKYALVPPTLSVQSIKGQFGPGAHKCWAVAFNNASEYGVESNIANWTQPSATPAPVKPGAPGEFKVE